MMKTLKQIFENKKEPTKSVLREEFHGTIHEFLIEMNTAGAEIITENFRGKIYFGNPVTKEILGTLDKNETAVIYK
jgi:hypothetical protein